MSCRTALAIEAAALSEIPYRDLPTLL
ncbi:hypothetical protein AVEN_10639-1, partial [Araneus ventricosus]